MKNNAKRKNAAGKKIATTIVVAAAVAFGIYFLAASSGTSPVKPGTTGTEAGDASPAFTLTTIGGKIIDSPSLRGKVAVISSAAQWCPTCQEEAKEFAPVYEKRRNDPVVFITIDIDPSDTANAIRQFQQTYRTPWDYADAQGGAEVIQKYGMNRFEMTYVLDKNGIVRFNGDVLTRPEMLDSIIQKWI